MKKNQSRTIVSTPRKQTAITYNSLGAMQPNKNFRAPLAWANMMISKVLNVHSFLHQKQGG